MSDSPLSDGMTSREEYRNVKSETRADERLSKYESCNSSLFTYDENQIPPKEDEDVENLFVQDKYCHPKDAIMHFSPFSMKHSLIIPHDRLKVSEF